MIFTDMDRSVAGLFHPDAKFIFVMAKRFESRVPALEAVLIRVTFTTNFATVIKGVLPGEKRGATGSAKRCRAMGVGERC